MKQNRAETLQMMADYLAIHASQAANAYDTSISSFTDDGFVSDKGLLLDVQANGSWVEAVVGGAILPLGRLSSHRRETRDIQETLVTRTARQAAIDAGQLVLEREVRFPLVVHYDTVDSWLTEVAREEPKLVILPA